MKRLAPWLARVRLQVFCNVFFAATGHISLGDLFCGGRGGCWMDPDFSEGLYNHFCFVSVLLFPRSWKSVHFLIFMFFLTYPLLATVRPKTLRYLDIWSYVIWHLRSYEVLELSCFSLWSPLSSQHAKWPQQIWRFCQMCLLNTFSSMKSCLQQGWQLTEHSTTHPKRVC